ncbi:TldD/PmbA family protein [Candidatus Woesearchaeota archaeon]|nr:TldD/PmbA family protein [Nanoarchaeota archaeon]MCB9370191.1 TldD/PmbA family protein [Candidatus Woesearchaeota archaeon]USN44719.1 MAG: TldD/PmbA family protein [Candidatus Woesearchaeota archaeon]
MKEALQKLIAMATEAGLYSDINLLNNSSSHLVVGKETNNLEKDYEKGIKIRIWDGEKYLEHAQSSLKEEELEVSMKKLIAQAKANQEHISEKKELHIDRTKKEHDFSSEAKIKLSDMSLEEKTKRLNAFKEKILSYSSDIVNVRVALIEETEKSTFANPYKYLSQQIDEAILVFVLYITAEDKTIRQSYESFVSNGLEVFEKAEEELPKRLEKVEAVKKAKRLKGGKYTVVLSPKLSGLLAHESFGHGMEADTMMRGRCLAKDWLGKRIGSDAINIVDYPAIAGKHGQFFFDAEGNEARKVYLVKNGIINEALSDNYSRTILGFEHASNARIESFDHKHYVRMSNTYFEAADKSEEELFSQVEDGIYITDSSGGMEDPKGWGVQIQGNFGQRIRNGKLVDEYYDGFTITGFLPEIISNIKGIGKEITIEGGGMCGKGHKEWVRVSEGGPQLLISGVTLG